MQLAKKAFVKFSFVKGAGARIEIKRRQMASWNCTGEPGVSPREEKGGIF